MFLKTLRSVAGQLPKEVRHFTNEYDAKNWKDYGIRVHAMKGMFATIGVRGLSERGRELEFAVKENRIEVCIEKGPKFVADIKEFAEKLGKIVQQQEVVQAVASTASVPAIVQSLIKALNASKSKEVEEQFKALKGAMGGNEQIDKIGDLIDDFDNEEAVKQLKTILAKEGENYV
jgi:HPt (histidine-containing phosphotransfer) domain-containing protein